MLQGLSIALTQVEAGNNEIRQIIYFCIEQKTLLKKYVRM